MIGFAAAGLAAGMVHVFSGPDHLAAMAPLVVDNRGSRSRAGFFWGLGHTAGMLAVGLAALALREMLPLDALSFWSERLVGIGLIAFGLWGCHRALSMRVHTHTHAHEVAAHTHVHVHAPGPHVADARQAVIRHTHTHASFAFGILHGLAGSSHMLGTLPALALPTAAASVSYLLAFGAGTIVAMTAFTSSLGWLANAGEQRGTSMLRAMLGTCSVAAIVVGAVWMVG